MLNILILMNPTQYPYHTAIGNMIQSTLQAQSNAVSILDINTFRADYLCLNRIKELQPDVLITLDLAGFHIRTQAGEIALNMLLTKNLNLVWGNKEEYAPLLNKKLSLSMLFYDVTGINHQLSSLYPNLLYYKTLGSLSSTEPYNSESREIFSDIWTDFTEEVLLT